MCFNNAKDIRLYLDEREDFIKLMKKQFQENNFANEFKVYGVPVKELKEYKSNNTSFSTEPEAKYLLADESFMKTDLTK